MTPISPFAERTAEIESAQRKFVERSAYVGYLFAMARGKSLDALGDSKASMQIRAAVSMSDTEALKNSAAAFVSAVDERSLIGALARVAVQATVGVPLLTLPADLVAHQVDDGQPIPVDRIAVAPTVLMPGALKNLFVLDGRVFQGPDARVKKGFDAWLTSALRRAWDGAVVDALADAAPVVGSGGTPATIAADLSALFASVSGGNPVTPILIASARAVSYLSATANSGGLFTNATLDNTGTILGAPLFVSSRAANKILLLDAAAFALADNGAIIEAGTASAIQMDSTPTNASAPVVASSLVSMYQTDSIALRAVRYLSFAPLSSDAVAAIEVVALGGSPA